MAVAETGSGLGAGGDTAVDGDALLVAAAAAGAVIVVAPPQRGHFAAFECLRALLLQYLVP